MVGRARHSIGDRTAGKRCVGNPGADGTFPSSPHPKAQLKARNFSPKTGKLPWCRKVVKPPEAVNSRQAVDSVAEINLKIWRVYPLQSASLEIELNSGAGLVPAPFLFLAGPAGQSGQRNCGRYGGCGETRFLLPRGVRSSNSFEDGYRRAGSATSPKIAVFSQPVQTLGTF